MAQFPEDEMSAEFVGGRTDGPVAYRRSAVGTAEIGSSQAHGHHGTILSHPSDRMELGVAEIYAQNENSRSQRYIRV